MKKPVITGAVILAFAFLSACVNLPEIIEYYDPFAELDETALLGGDENLLLIQPADRGVPGMADAGPSGGSLSLSMRMPLTLNPLLNEDITVARILRLLYEPLIGLDEELRPTSKILQSFELSEDGTRATLTLRENLQWDNGSPITANDIIFSLNTLVNSSPYSIYRSAIQNISSFSIANEGRGVVIIYSQPTNYAFAYRLGFPVIPAHHFAGSGQFLPSSPANMSPVGNGPFRFVSMRPAQELVLTPNNLSLRTRANIGRIRVLITPDAQTDMNAFNNGLIDVLRLDNATQVVHTTTRSINETSYTNSHFEFIGFNFQNDVLARLPFRRAVAHSLNFAELLPAIYLDKATRASTPINPQAWFYDPNTFPYPFNPELAASLLNDAGLEYFSGDGRRGIEVGGVVFEFGPLRILVNEENPERIMMAEAISEALSGLYLNSEVVRLGFEEYTAALVSGNFDIFIGGFNMPIYADIGFAFSSEAIGGLNFSSYASTVMDTLIEQVNSSITHQDFSRNTSELQHFFAYNLPAIGLVYRKSALLTAVEILGELNPGQANIYQNIHEWYLLSPN